LGCLLQFHYPEKRFLFKVVCEKMPCSIYAVFCLVVVIIVVFVVIVVAAAVAVVDCCGCF